MGDSGSATVHEIVARHRRFEVDPAHVEQFELGPGEPVDASSLARDPTWSLYAIDAGRDRALLVQLPATVDLATVPFAYVAQFDHAHRAALVSTAELISLSEQVEQPANLVHLFSTGRCGSTLASRIFAELEGIWSVSEPDAIAQLIVRRDEYGTERMRSLLRAATRWSFRPLDDRGGRTCVLKYRSEALFDAVDFLIATPDSSALFLWRDLPGWVDSSYRFAQKHGLDVRPGSDVNTVGWPILSAGAAPELVADICDVTDPWTPFEVVLAALWTLRVEAFDAGRGAGVPFHAVGYAELDRDRERTVSSLLDALGLLSPTNLHAAMRGYEQDSQVGTAGARDRRAEPLDAEQRAMLARLASEHPRVRAAVELVSDLERGAP